MAERSCSAVLRVELSRPLDGAQVPLLVKRLLGLHYVEQVDTAGLRADEDAAQVDEDDDGLSSDYAGRAELNVHDQTLLLDLAEEDSEKLVDTTTPADGVAGSRSELGGSSRFASELLVSKSYQPRRA